MCQPTRYYNTVDNVVGQLRRSTERPTDQALALGTVIVTDADRKLNLPRTTESASRRPQRRHVSRTRQTDTGAVYKIVCRRTTTTGASAMAAMCRRRGRLRHFVRNGTVRAIDGGRAYGCSSRRYSGRRQ